MSLVSGYRVEQELKTTIVVWELIVQEVTEKQMIEEWLQRCVWDRRNVRFCYMYRLVSNGFERECVPLMV